MPPRYPSTLAGTGTHGLHRTLRTCAFGYAVTRGFWFCTVPAAAATTPSGISSHSGLRVMT